MFFRGFADLAISILVFALIVLPAHGSVLGRQGTTGCGLTHSTGQSTDASIVSGKRERQFRIHVSSSYGPDIPAPVLFSFHGATKTMADQEQITHFSNDSTNPYMIVVYPLKVWLPKTLTSWEGAPYHENLPSDKVFVSDLIRNLKSQYCVDDSRIYANGMSNGGGFVNTLACSSDPGANFAAFAPVSGAFYDDDVDMGTTDCQPALSPLPILEFHGLADKKIPYFGPASENGPVPTIPDWLAEWARRNGCQDPSNSKHEASFPGYKQENFTCNGVSDIVQHYNISGLGHVWPTKHNSPIDASSRIIDFFNAHRKP